MRILAVSLVGMARLRRPRRVQRRNGYESRIGHDLFRPLLRGRGRRRRAIPTLSKNSAKMRTMEKPDPDSSNQQTYRSQYREYQHHDFKRRLVDAFEYYRAEQRAGNHGDAQ